MSIATVKALTFDTGGTILDWHSGFVAALSSIGVRHGIERDWHGLANEIRRKSLDRVLHQGGEKPASMNFDEAHRRALDEICDTEDLPFDASERQIIAWQAPHAFRCWSDFPNELPRLRRRFLCVSFTLLSFRLILDTARANDLQWDGILSCETLGVYKPLPAAYETVARMLQLEPAECCMVACHTFDLDAAKAVGFRTAYVRRRDEWGPDARHHDPLPTGYDIAVETFGELRSRLGS